jgi:hypothetical protein
MLSVAVLLRGRQAASKETQQQSKSVVCHCPLRLLSILGTLILSLILSSQRGMKQSDLELLGLP